MGLPPVLSESALARFRTKRCERLLATGTCPFGDDKCQYSHDSAWLRRNPHKHSYAPNLCAKMRHGRCEHGAQCRFAHSQEEALYHPLAYKTAPCRDAVSCDRYYCAFAHAPWELRECGKASTCTELATAFPSVAVLARKRSAKTTSQSPSSSRRGCRGMGRRGPAPPQELCKFLASSGGVGGGAAASCPAAPCPEELGEAAEENDGCCPIWWTVDPRLRVALVPPEKTQRYHPCQLCDGVALLGGRVVPGLLQPKVCSESQPEVRCRVKLVPAGRREGAEASKVLTEVKRWMALAKRGGRHTAALEVRRTVATIFLAFPEEDENASSLGHRFRRSSLPGSLGGHITRLVTRPGGLVHQAAVWVHQLATEVCVLHEEGIAHACIAPCTILVDKDGTLRLGDFLGKLRLLCLLAQDGNGEDMQDRAAWAMWYPPEIHARLSSVRSKAADNGMAGGAATGVKEADSTLFLFRVDAWQLGVAIFYLLTGEHPFGARREPEVVCRNILADYASNLHLVEDYLPSLADLVKRLTEQTPEKRALPKEALNFAASLLHQSPSDFWFDTAMSRRIYSII